MHKSTKAVQNYNKKQKYERKVEEIYDLANAKIRITSFLGKKGSQKRVTQNACNPAVKCLHFSRGMLAFQTRNACISETECLHFRNGILAFQKRDDNLPQKPFIPAINNVSRTSLVTKTNLGGYTPRRVQAKRKVREKKRESVTYRIPRRAGADGLRSS